MRYRDGGEGAVRYRVEVGETLRFMDEEEE